MPIGYIREDGVSILTLKAYFQQIQAEFCQLSFLLESRTGHTLITHHGIFPFYYLKIIYEKRKLSVENYYLNYPRESKHGIPRHTGNSASNTGVVLQVIPAQPMGQLLQLCSQWIRIPVCCAPSPSHLELSYYVSVMLSFEYTVLELNNILRKRTVSVWYI